MGEDLYTSIRPYLVLEVNCPYKTPVNKPFLKNGDYHNSVCAWYDEQERELVSGPFSRVEFEEPDLGSRQKLIKQLIRHGWKPTVFTEKGSPKLTEKGHPVDSLYKIEAPVGKAIAEWYTMRHRKSQIEGWIKTVRTDGRLTAGANSCGTNTYRMRHRGVVNVPKADPKVTFGKQMRELFIARPGYKLLGYDASGLEARCMAHYTHKFDGGEFADLVLNGDVHAKNARIFFESETDGLNVDSSEFKSYRSRGKNGTYCVPMDTQILTKTGWKTRDQLEIGELVLTYNQKENVKEWKPVLAIHDTEGEVVELSHGNSFKVRASHDHRWFVRQRKDSGSGRYMMDQVRTTDELTSESNIIINAPMRPDAGSFSGWHGTKYGRDWTKEVLSMSSEQRKAFLAGFLIADGYQDNSSGLWKFTQLRNEHYEAALTAAFIEHDGFISVRSGVQENGKECMVVCLRKKQHTTMQRVSRRILPEQKLWCVTTENESWVMRQGDMITITGNCLMYGGQPRKLASTLEVPLGQAKHLFDKFWRENEALGEVRNLVMKMHDQRGWVPGIDGRKIYTRSSHSALNALFQSCGAILMKRAMVMLRDFALEEQIHHYKVYDMHDEGGHEILEDECYEENDRVVHRLGFLAEDAMKAAGEYYNIRVPITGEFLIGNNWAEVH